MDSWSFRATYSAFSFTAGVSKLRAKFGSRRRFVNNEKIISLQKLVDLVECNVLYTETITLRKMMYGPLNVV